MTQLRVRIGEAAKPQPSLIWDSVWDAARGKADWALAGADEPQNRGGLRAKSQLHSAVLIQLFSNKFCPADHPHRKFIDGSDYGGWWGSSVDVRADLGEEELGSLLWIYARAPLNEEIRRYVEAEARSALQTFIRQGAVSRIDVAAKLFAAVNRLELTVQMYGRDGTRVFDLKFADLWKQVAK